MPRSPAGGPTPSTSNVKHGNPLSGFALPSIPVAATVRLQHGKPRPGEVFVGARVPHHSGPETVLEMLNRPEPFFAFRPAGDREGGVLFAARAQTVVVTVTEAPLDDPDRLSAAKRLRLDVTLFDGSILSGWAHAELPDAHSRPLDYLNASAEPFFAMAAEDRTHYVNRAHVVFARPED